MWRGTTAVDPTGEVHAPGDAYKQTLFVLDRISKALAAVGSELRHVVRTRAYIAEMSAADEVVRAHGEVFKGIEPVMTGVEAGLARPGMMIEIDVDAIVHDLDGNISAE
ncbi:MAG: hypothetical protein Kilf2KO_43470 [Rhodospirillales bacterium]